MLVDLRPSVEKTGNEVALLPADTVDRENSSAGVVLPPLPLVSMTVAPDVVLAALTVVPEVGDEPNAHC